MPQPQIESELIIKPERIAIQEPPHYQSNQIEEQVAQHHFPEPGLNQDVEMLQIDSQPQDVRGQDEFVSQMVHAHHYAIIYEG